jgi:hypothetical protein
VQPGQARPLFPAWRRLKDAIDVVQAFSPLPQLPHTINACGPALFESTQIPECVNPNINIDMYVYVNGTCFCLAIKNSNAKSSTVFHLPGIVFRHHYRSLAKSAGKIFRDGAIVPFE